MVLYVSLPLKVKLIGAPNMSSALNLFVALFRAFFFFFVLGAYDPFLFLSELASAAVEKLYIFFN